MLRSRWRARQRWAGPLSAVLVLCLGAIPAAGAGLPNGRAYELSSPAGKFGIDLVAESSRTHASTVDAPGAAAAVTFTALGGFADVQGIGIGTEYMSERDGAAGTSGWATHAITPPQEPLPYNALVAGAEPNFQGEMSGDLTKGVFKAWSPLTNAPNVAHVPNLYMRDDLRTPGAGFFRLITNGVALLPAPDQSTDSRMFVGGTSSDFQHVVFETKENLTSDASGTNVKLYKTDGSTTRLVAGPTCPGLNGGRALAPCSSAGRGLMSLHYSPRVLSSDGSRVMFTAPVNGIGGVQSTPGAASKLFQLDDRGTSTTADDAVVQINASEASSPDPTSAATYETASTDGSRVFFTSNESLTNDTPAGGGLYMWARQPTNEVQSVAVDATAGTFTLTAHAQPSAGSGTLENGSTSVTNVTGSFSVGQTIAAPDIPAGTTIVAVPGSTSLTLSAPARADGDEALSASIDATTAPLAHDATAGQVQSALEGLSVVGSGNVTVRGGPGGAGGGVPYEVTFTGALGGVNVAQVTADASDLAGGAATADVATTTPVRNLTRIAAASAVDVLGASEDGHRLYFASAGDQLVSGAPAITKSGLYYWQDADGTPGGTLSFIGDVTGSDMFTNGNNTLWNTSPRVSRVSPDGRYLLFEVADGSDLAPRYDQSGCVGIIFSPNISGSGCSEVYLYRADGSSPTVPDVMCASCIPSGERPASAAWVNIRRNASVIPFSTHLDHALSDDGRYVFFSTGDALVPEDTNRKFDAYEYDVASGTPRLLTSGKDTADSYFMEASADGRDAYVLTRERLVGWDRDNSYDLYDVRVGGGFPDPPAPAQECGGDACQGVAPGAPSGAALGSAAFRGAGDARAHLRSRAAHRRCKRGQVKRRVRGRTRCVRRAKPKHAKRHASAKRRAK